METVWYRPDGPFAPLRRWMFWGSILAFFASIVAAIAGFWGTAVVLWVGLPWVVIGWIALWFVDMVLAYLKTDPDASSELRA